MKEQIESIRQEIAELLSERGQKMTSKELYSVKMEYLGKTGKISALSKGMREVAPEDRPMVGKLVGEIRQWAEEQFSELETSIGKRELAEKIAGEKIDVTMPAKFHETGSVHPVTLVRRELIDIFSGMGFDVFEGPEIEKDYYNFQALNIPADHPARDMQDTFFEHTGRPSGARHARYLFHNGRIFVAISNVVRPDPRHGKQEASDQSVESGARISFRFRRDAFADVPSNGGAGRGQGDHAERFEGDAGCVCAQDVQQ